MSVDDEHGNAIFDHNLEMIGQRLPLSAEPTARQRASWKIPMAGPKGHRATGASRFGLLATRRPLQFAAAAGFALMLATLVWLGFDGARAASAAIFFDGFRNALARPTWIDIKQVDLDTVVISGQAYIEFGEAPDLILDDVLYSELHAKLRADNPRWADIDAVAVTCQTPDGAWMYTFGNGIGGPITEGPDGRLLPSVPEEYVRERGWMDLLSEPLGQFGGIPTFMSLSDGSETVTYGFGAGQRDFVRSLMNWLLAFAGEDTAERLVADLETMATDVRIDTSDPDHWILVAKGFLGPDPAEASAQLTLEYRAYINPETKQIVGGDIWDVKPGEDELTAEQQEAKILFFKNLWQFGTVGEVEDYLRPLAESVKLDKSNPQRWTLRALDVRVPVDELRGVSTGEFIRNVQFTLHYDPETEVVYRAEFSNVGSASGQVRIELGGRPIDPAILEPKRWVADPSSNYSSP